MNSILEEKLKTYLKKRGILLSKDELQELREEIHRELERGKRELPEILEELLTSKKKSFIIPQGGSSRRSSGSFNPLKSIKTRGSTMGPKAMTFMSSPMITEPIPSGSLGLSTGGSKDIGNFRQNILEGYQPLIDSITYEGLFYEYYFKTDYISKKEGLFSPAYSCSTSINPITEEKEHYLSISLSSNLKIEDFQRKNLNLVLVLDISGSMSSSFDSYYYDRQEEREEKKRTKLEIAIDSILGLLKHLREEDRLGIIFFESSPHKGLDLTPLKEIDLPTSKKNLKRLRPMGGTNLEGALREAKRLFDKVLEEDNYQNRMIVLTDQMPNIGAQEGLDEYIAKLATSSIYSTFIGVGIDFNTELVEKMTKVEGANYYSVHTKEEFLKRMDEEFDYMVTPLAFNLCLKLESEDFSIEEVYGSPEASKRNGEVMRVNTLFPSPTKDGESKGGIILLKLHRESDGDGDGKIHLKASYRDADQREEKVETSLIWEEKSIPFYPDKSTRKAILLIHYAEYLRQWLSTSGKKSIELPEEDFGRWEHPSSPLTVSKEYEKIFLQLKDHLQEEMKEIGDGTLEKDLEILDILSRERSRE